jgi:hypothetical protein
MTGKAKVLVGKRTCDSVDVVSCEDTNKAIERGKKEDIKKNAPFLGRAFQDKKLRKDQTERGATIQTVPVPLAGVISYLTCPQDILTSTILTSTNNPPRLTWIVLSIILICSFAVIFVPSMSIIINMVMIITSIILFCQGIKKIYFDTLLSIRQIIDRVIMWAKRLYNCGMCAGMSTSVKRGTGGLCDMYGVYMLPLSSARVEIFKKELKWIM